MLLHDQRTFQETQLDRDTAWQWNETAKNSPTTVSNILSSGIAFRTRNYSQFKNRAKGIGNYYVLDSNHFYIFGQHTLFLFCLLTSSSHSLIITYLPQHRQYLCALSQCPAVLESTGLHRFCHRAGKKNPSSSRPLTSHTVEYKPAHRGLPICLSNLHLPF